MKSGGKKVFVGVSGGVDSSVALALLKKEGYDVTGVFLKVWNPDWMECNWKEERRDSMRVCATLGVAHLTLDCQAEYKKEVVDYMIREYSLGRVPNPDVFCNKYIKFGVFQDKALEMGADFIATGHYARRYEYTNDTNGYELREAVDKNKDQSYFLYTLNQEQLAHTLFPIGHLTKPEVRKLAEKFGLPTATKKDSQGLCFIGKVDMKDFLSHYIDKKPGDVITTSDVVIGKHDGAMFYTIGQRHGYTITKKTTTEPRLFVVSKDLAKNTITVSPRFNLGEMKESESGYFVKEIIMSDLHFISDVKHRVFNNLKIRIRYRQEKQKCIVEKKSDGYHIIFENPQSGVAIGQSAVLYFDNVCLGGGIIEVVV